MPPFSFARSWIIFTIYSEFFFQIDRLSPLQLAVLLGFYLAPSSATYFFVISFCVNFFVCGLLSAGCRIMVLLASGVFPLMREVGPEACAVILLIGGLAGVVVTRDCFKY